MDARYSIGDLGRQTGTKVQTIRYYEQIGVMPEPVRTAGGQRRYGHVKRHQKLHPPIASPRNLTGGWLSLSPL